MAFIKTRRTLKGLTYHLVDVINGNEISTKLPVINKTEANRYLMKYLGDKSDNRPNSLFTEKVSFKEFVENTYFPYSKPKKTEKTFKVHKNELIILMKSFGNMNLDQITVKEIERFQAESLMARYAKKTVNNRVALVSAVLHMAYKHQLILRLPEIKLLKLDILPPRGLDADTVAKLLSVAKEQDTLVYDISVVALNSGLRLSELVNLKWEDINFPQKQLIVRKAKSHKFRAIPLNNTLEAHLLNIYKNMALPRIYVFQHDGQPYYFSSFDRRFRELVRANGIDASMHRLRHTFASRLVQKGVSLYEVQKLLGHSTISTTERYAHLRMDNLAKAVGVLEIDGTATEPSKNLTLQIA